ncbi:MAG: hypothetical protein LBT59_18225 [Clostridiales bacterium]|jgi:hypothetical protein|nr:hypothetical protein [Clostridiales bacterium]
MSKAKQAIIISALALLMLSIVGTYAWTSFNGGILNEFSGSDEIPGGTTHDDLNRPNKDVYVENWGNTSIFVRVRITEYMEIGENAGEDVPGKTVEVIGPGTPLLNDRTTWKAHVPYGGDPRVGDDGSSFSKYWEWTMGGEKWYMPVSSANRVDGYIDQNTTVYTGTEPGVKRTRNATVITMNQWIALGSPIGDYWVGDSDGWFYWAAPVLPGDATGLLIDAIDKRQTIVGPYGGSYYYAVYVDTQMATAFSAGPAPDDYRNFADPDKGGWTEEGENLLKLITAGEAPTPTSVPTSSSPTASPTPAPTASPTSIPTATPTPVSTALTPEKLPASFDPPPAIGGTLDPKYDGYVHLLVMTDSSNLNYNLAFDGSHYLIEIDPSAKWAGVYQNLTYATPIWTYMGGDMIDKGYVKDGLYFSSLAGLSSGTYLIQVSGVDNYAFLTLRIGKSSGRP